MARDNDLKNHRSRAQTRLWATRGVLWMRSVMLDNLGGTEACCDWEISHEHTNSTLKKVGDHFQVHGRESPCLFSLAVPEEVKWPRGEQSHLQEMAFSSS